MALLTLFICTEGLPRPAGTDQVLQAKNVTSGTFASVTSALAVEVPTKAAPSDLVKSDIALLSASYSCSNKPRYAGNCPNFYNCHNSESYNC
eukprot:2158087-Prymnesium_polylepis.2